VAEVIDIIVSGHLCIDLIPQMDHVPLEKLATPGRLFETGPLAVATGGAVSNTGLALHRLGVDVRLMATVGDDILGQTIINILKNRDERLAQLISVQPDQSSSYTVVLSPAKADRIFLHCPCTNSAFGVTNIDFSLLSQARIFHLGYPPILPRLMANNGQELTEIYQRAKQAGVITSLDMTLPDPNGPSGQVDWMAILRNALPYVDIFVPSIEEIVFMMRRDDYDAWDGRVLEHLDAGYLSHLADELLSMGPRIAGFKLSELGLYLKTSDSMRIRQLDRLSLDANAWANVELYSPAFQVELVSTLGAGDSAYAGFLAALLRGMTPADTIRWACAVGAHNVEAADATSGVRTWAEIQSRLDSGWALKSIRLPGM
jgi:sugar/nucleoside kinase (ribokinase family)